VTTCPFQIDFALTFDDIMELEENEDDLDLNDVADDSQSECDEKSQDFFDCFVNIKQKLDDAKVAYLSAETDEKSDAFTQFKTQFNMFRRKKIQQKYNYNNAEQYPQLHRFVALIDRRKPNDDNREYVADSDEIIFYEAKPMTLPKEPCSLWFFESSKTCIIPGKEVEHDSELSDAQKEKIKPKTSLDPCMGSLMILSFHVEADDTTKCYMYLHGQLLRFFPDDLVQILPRYFVDNEQNKKFVNSSDAKEMVKSIKANLRDKKFEDFYGRFQCRKPAQK